jgi:hypothetical protein
MKLKLSAIAAVTFACATFQANAQVNIYLSGAASVKDTIYNTIVQLYGPNLTAKNLDKPSTPASANNLVFSGQMTNLFGNQTVNISINYSGSGPALQSLAQNTSVSFFSSAVQGNTNLTQSPIDIGFSIVYQKDYPYGTPVLNDYIYGATPTFFVKSPLAPAGLTNFTSQDLRVITANGSAPQSLFTGNSNDTSVLYWVMRDIGAATRIISAKEAGFTGTQLAYFYNTNTATWVLDPIGQLTWPIVINQVTNMYGPCMTFITPPDGGSIAPGNFVRFNGYLPFKGTFQTATTNDYSPVINGQYTCWGYEHIFTRPSPPANVTTFYTALSTALATNIQTSSYSIPLNRMLVSRSATGGVVSPQ